MKMFQKFAILIVLFMVTQAFDEETNQRMKRVIGGEEVTPHSIPYQAGILVQFSITYGFCGGVLISNLHILTAAHCLYDRGYRPKRINVFLGAHRIQDPEPYKQRIVAKDYRIHEHFNYDLMLNDIGVVILPWQIDFNDYISPVSLPSSNMHMKFTHMNVTLSGWGYVQTRGNITNELRKIDLEIIENEKCASIWSMFNKKITDTHLCAQRHNVNTCTGDSGSPLVLTNEKILIGLTSFGFDINCNITEIPSVFTNVVKHLPWIYATIK